MTALQTAIAYWYRTHGIQADEKLSEIHGSIVRGYDVATLRNCNGVLGKVAVMFVVPKNDQRGTFFRCREV